MKASELVEQLKMLIDEGGDLEIAIYDHHTDSSAMATLVECDDSLLYVDRSVLVIL